MGMFDFLGGGGAVANTAGLSSPADAGGSIGLHSFETGAKKLFSDPNFQEVLGKTGAQISAGVPIGQAVGQGAFDWARNKALQSATAKNLAGQSDLQSILMKNLSSLLTPSTDNKGFDSATVDGDGNITLKVKNSNPKMSAIGGNPTNWLASTVGKPLQLSDKPIESKNYGAQNPVPFH